MSPHARPGPGARELRACAVRRFLVRHAHANDHPIGHRVVSRRRLLVHARCVACCSVAARDVVGQARRSRARAAGVPAPAARARRLEELERRVAVRRGRARRAASAAADRPRARRAHPRAVPDRVLALGHRASCGARVVPARARRAELVAQRSRAAPLRRGRLRGARARERRARRDAPRRLRPGRRRTRCVQGARRSSWSASSIPATAATSRAGSR